MNFEECVAIVLDFEGGYVWDSNDPGGETKYGISKRQYPEENIKELTIDKAVEIYKRDYWERIDGDLLPDYIRLLAFDCAVNQGAPRAILYLQRSAGVDDDGIMGPKTVKALYNAEPSVLVREFALQRHHSYSRNPHWDHFGAGWSKRLLDVVLITFAYVDMD